MLECWLMGSHLGSELALVLTGSLVSAGLVIVGLKFTWGTLNF